jgi:hypothetical protein
MSNLTQEAIVLVDYLLTKGLTREQALEQGRALLTDKAASFKEVLDFELHFGEKGAVS